MKLNKALKLKNKLVDEINQLKHKISKNNSTIVGNEFMTNNKELYDTYLDKVRMLTSLKAAIAEANVPINSVIYNIGETKDRLTFLNDLDTESGQIPPEGYRNSIVLTKHVQFNSTWADEQIKIAKDEIELMQDKLDEFNAVTEINFTFTT